MANAHRENFIEDKHLDFFDKWYLTSASSALGATAGLLKEFPDLSRFQALQILIYWSKTTQGPFVRGASL